MKETYMVDITPHHFILLFCCCKAIRKCNMQNMPLHAAIVVSLIGIVLGSSHRGVDAPLNKIEILHGPQERFDLYDYFGHLSLSK